jgi:alpha-mannosidase
MKHLDISNGHIYSYPMHNYWFTNYQADQSGSHTFRYAITSAARLSAAELARFDADTRRPLVGYALYDTGNVRYTPVKRRMPSGSGEFFKIDSTHATVSSFKQAEDGRGFILRLQETGGEQGMAKFASPVFPLARVELANGVEDARAPLAVKGGVVEIPLKPWTYTTVRVTFAPAQMVAKQ